MQSGTYQYGDQGRGQTSNRLGGYGKRERSGESSSQSSMDVSQCVEEYPVTSLLTTFAVGAVVGCAAVVMLHDDSERRSYQGMAKQWLQSMANSMPQDWMSSVSKYTR